MKNGRWKLLGLISVALLFFVAVLVFSIAEIINSMDMDYINREYKSLQSSLNLQQSMIYDRLVESSYLLAENSTFKANLQLDDNNSLDYSAKDFALFMKVDLFVILDRYNNVKFDLHHNLNSNTDITNFGPIQKNLHGQDPQTTFTNANLLALNNTIYQIVAVPIFVGKDRTLGTIIMGVDFENFVLKPVGSSSPFNLYFYYNNKATTSRGAALESSITDISAASQNNALNNFKHNVSAKGFRYLWLDGIKNMVFTAPLGASDKGLLLATIQAKGGLKNIYFWNNYYALVAISSFITFTFVTAFAGWQISKEKVL